MILLLSQKNQLFDAISRTGYFSPSMFTLQEDEDEYRISYKDSSYYFALKAYYGNGEDFIVSVSPAEYKISDSRLEYWSSVPTRFEWWLNYLKRETSSPDKWGRLFEEMQYLTTSEETSNGKFTHEEFLNLESKINYLKSALPTIPMTIPQLEAINSKLDHLLSLATELNKFDWQNLFIGAIMSIIIQLGVMQENAFALYTLIKQTFSGLFLQ